MVRCRAEPAARRARRCSPGCGFELRRAPELHFRSVQLTGFPPRFAARR
jgi:hypothetical protein